MLEKIHAKGWKTHMPFLVEGPDGVVCFFCFKEEPLNVWKIYCSLEGADPKRLETGMSDDTTECCPTAWFDGESWHLSFVAGGSPSSKAFHLYKAESIDLEELTNVTEVIKTKTGFVYRDRVAFSELKDRVFVQCDLYGDRTLKIEGAFIFAVRYRTDKQCALLISGQWEDEEEVFTIEYDLHTGEQYYLVSDGKPAYKCTVFKNKLLYADRVSGYFEDRKILEAVNIITVSTDVVIEKEGLEYVE